MIDSWAVTLTYLLIVASRTSGSEGFGMPRSTINAVVVDMERTGTSIDKSRLCNWACRRAYVFFVRFFHFIPFTSGISFWVVNVVIAVLLDMAEILRRKAIWILRAFLSPKVPALQTANTQAFHFEGIEVGQEWLEPNFSGEEQQYIIKVASHVIATTHFVPMIEAD
jgi:hypothetical protein